MTVNVRPNSDVHALNLDRETYDQLVRRNEKGWSHCANQTEWLAKLNYLRQGFTDGKLERADFEKREFRLVHEFLNYLFD